MKLDWQAQTAAQLRQNLGIEARFSPFPGADRLPLLITETFEVGRCEVLGKTLLALKARAEAPTPAVLAKQADWLSQRTGLRSLFILTTLGARDRKRLIENRVPFLSLGSQFYLPDLGIDLNEQPKPRDRQLTKVSPPAQVVVLACVWRRIDPRDEFTGAGLAKEFGYTKMTMTRALDELRRAGLVAVEGVRRFARHRFLCTGRELWEQARPWLRSPITRRVYLDDWPAGAKYRAGESALGEMTLLGAPRRAIWAVTGAQWRQMQQEPGAPRIAEVAEAAAHAEFEIWRYAPNLLSEPPCVDRLSLALSLADTTDERVQMAVAGMLEGVAW